MMQAWSNYLDNIKKHKIQSLFFASIDIYETDNPRILK
jgi:hypothetical protein